MRSDDAADTVSVLGALDVFGLDPNPASSRVADVSSSEGYVEGPVKAASSLGGAWQVVVRSQVKAYHLPLEQFKRLPTSIQRVSVTLVRGTS